MDQGGGDGLGMIQSSYIYYALYFYYYYIVIHDEIIVQFILSFYQNVALEFWLK